MNGRLALLLSCLLLWHSAQAQSAARVWLDRNAMQFGETVTLSIEAQGELAEPADQLTQLLEDFEIVGRSSSTRVEMSGAELRRVTTWAYALSPRRSGSLQVPALNIAGSLSAAIDLQVHEATISDSPVDDVFIEVELEQDVVYVQQPVVLTLRLHYALTLTEGSLSLPSADDLVVDTLGNDSSYSAVRDGRRFEVLQRRYLLTPEASGDIQLPPARFTGRAMDPQRGGFFGRGRGVQAEAVIPALRVRPRPADSGSGPWLPARALEFGLVGAGWPSQVRAGEPFMIEVRIAARGLAATQLPDPELQLPEGLRAYPEASRAQALLDARGVAGQRLRGFALIASRPGRIEIPEQTLIWWDTAADQAQTARIPAHSIEVLPASGSEPESAVPMAERGDAAPRQFHSGHWPALSAVFASLWLLAMLAWWSERRRRVHTQVGTHAAPPEAGRSLRQHRLQHALRAGELAAIEAALLDLAAATWPKSPPRGLGALSLRLDDPQQRGLIAALQAARYSPHGDDPALASRLRAGFRCGLAAASSAPQATPGLAPLYPQG